MGWFKRLQDQYGPQAGRCICRIPEFMECGTVVPYHQGNIGYQTDVSLHTTEN